MPPRTTDDRARARGATSSELKLLEELQLWRASLPRIALVLSSTVARSDTAQKLLFTIPAGFEAHVLVVHGETGSNAGTSAVLDIGRLGLPAVFVSAHSVLGNAGLGQRAPVARRLGVPAVEDVPVYGRYAETGAPSTAGGPWTITVMYSKAGN
jgi:hypothetical protein